MTNRTATDLILSSLTSAATITERGNGLPDVGDYVPGTDGELYRIVSMESAIHTDGAGGGMWVRAQVDLADWADCAEEDEHTASCAVEAQS
jgi:hypothetical protein